MTEEEKQKIKTPCKKIIGKDQILSQKFLSCTQGDQEWVLNYLSSGKGTVPYEMITRFDSLDIVPVKEFFTIKQFYSVLKGDLISEEEYKAVKKLYLALKMENLGELNNLHNYQDIITLCEVFES